MFMYEYVCKLARIFNVPTKKIDCAHYFRGCCWLLGGCWKDNDNEHNNERNVSHKKYVLLSTLHEQEMDYDFIV